MSPRIDPHLPLVWRTPNELQLGATPRVVLSDPGELETGLIAALRHGVSLETAHKIGRGLGGSPAAVQQLLEALAPAFEAGLEAQAAPGTISHSIAGASRRRRADAAASEHSRPVIALDAAPAIAARLVEHLAVLGYETVPAADAAIEDTALAVIVASWVVAPARHLPWLRADVPHLAVVFDDAGLRIGPLVEPGEGPCLRCLDLARRDDDAAWPVIAAQLTGRPAASCTPRAIHDAVAGAASVVDDRLAHGQQRLREASLRLSRPGERAQLTRHPVHSECGCRAPAGTATAPARPGIRHPGAASSVRDAAVPA